MNLHSEPDTTVQTGTLSAALRTPVCVLLVALLLSAHGATGEEPTSTNSASAGADTAVSVSVPETPGIDLALNEELPAHTSPEFETVEWIDLMPKEDLEALLNPPSYLDEVLDGSAEDQISNQIQNPSAAASHDPYQQALVSTRVVAEMNNQAIRIPGFVVPLEFNDDQTVTQFFLVPFFGACIHMPPPPPNQIIFVNYPEGLNLEALYDPLWVSGVLKTAVTGNDIATSAYSMDMQSYESYHYQ